MKLYIPITGHSALQHLTAFTSMAEDLRNLGSAVTEQQLLMKTLYTLPPSYRGLMSYWLGVAPADQTLANFTTRLLAEEALISAMNQGEMDPADVAFFARTNPSTSIAAAVTSKNEEYAHSPRGNYSRGGRGYRGRGYNRGYRNDHEGQNKAEGNNSNPSASTVQCYECNGFGHKGYQCPNRRNEEREEQRSQQHTKNRKSFGFVSASLCLVASNPNLFYADSAATSHMTYKREFFSSFESIPPGTWKVTGIGGVELEATGKGSINITSLVDGQEIEGTFNNVLLVPGLAVNLFSVGLATEAGVEVLFQGTKALFKTDGSTVMVGKRVGASLYQLHVTPTTINKQQTTAAVAESTSPIQLIHQRFAHVNCKDLKRTLIEGVRSSMYNSNVNESPNTFVSVKQLWGEFMCATVYIRILEEVVYRHRELVANAEGNKNFKLKKLAEYGLKKKKKFFFSPSLLSRPAKWRNRWL